MKGRIFFLFALLVVACGAVNAQTPTPTPLTTTTSTPTPTPLTTTTPKPTPTPTPKPTAPSTLNGWEQTIAGLEKFNKGVTTFAFTLASLVVILLSGIVIYRLLILIARRSSQLVIDNFSNASGEDELDKVLIGISQLAREKLVDQIEGVRQRVKKHIHNLAPSTYPPPDKSPLPQANQDQRLAELVTSLSTFTPQQLSPVVQLLKVIFPPFGTKVASILHSQGEEHSKLGITFEITDIQGHLAPKLYTIWEPAEEKSKDFPPRSKIAVKDRNKIWRLANEKPKNSLDVAVKKALKDRYRALLNPANRWLAIELSRREMMASIPFQYNFLGKNQRDRYQGEIHNFFGVYNQSSARTYGNFFYQLAIEDFLAAIKLYPNWYQPYVNLALTYSLQAQEMQSDKRRRRCLSKALERYEEGLKIADDQIEDETVQRQIRVGKAITLLLMSDHTILQEAQTEIDKIETGCKDYDKELNNSFLYNLASLYAIAKRLDVGNAQYQANARRYLAYSLVRAKDNEDFWAWAGEDPDLEGIRDGLENLQFELKKKIKQCPQLPELKGEKFAKAIEEVLKKVKWL